MNDECFSIGSEEEGAGNLSPSLHQGRLNFSSVCIDSDTRKGQLSDLCAVPFTGQRSRGGERGPKAPEQVSP